MYSPILGVEARQIWLDRVGYDPDIEELVRRYSDVSAAVGRYREAGLIVPKLWLRELGTSQQRRSDGQ